LPFTIMASYIASSAAQCMGGDGKGWLSIEEVLEGNPTWIGYDAAICVELFKPWIVEVYNSATGQPSTMRIVEVLHSYISTRGNSVNQLLK
ncbi:hypothetical protein DXG01_010480, partial [Tephrocybe rancida]